MVDRPNVTIIDLKRTPIQEFEAKGIRTSDDNLHEFDVIILATGYDAVTGSLTEMGLTDTDGVPLSERWANGVSTYLGLAIPKLPNLFMAYSPQAPTAFANGPTIIEIQLDWIVAAIQKMVEEGIKYIDARPSFAAKWKADIQTDHAKTLFMETDSWYTGANIPGKHREQLLYLRGVYEYGRVTKSVLEENSWEGFDVVR